MQKNKDIFEYGGVYHVFSRTNNQENLFRTEENKRYFLQLLQQKLRGFVKIYAYALLYNHFHLAVQVEEEDSILKYISGLPIELRSKSINRYAQSNEIDRNVNILITTQFSRVLNSYTQSFNKRYHRKGNLFNHSMKRSLLKSDSAFTNLIYYIHHNSRKHGNYSNFLDDKWHSYHEIVNCDSVLIDYNLILEWFGGLEGFQSYHQEKFLERDFKSFWLE